MTPEEIDALEAVAQSFSAHRIGMSPGTVLYLLDELRAYAVPESIKDSQHCTFAGDDDYQFSHTAGSCGRPQPRRCGCPYCYPEGG